MGKICELGTNAIVFFPVKGFVAHEITTKINKKNKK
jgi:hypothetical protein